MPEGHDEQFTLAALDEYVPASQGTQPKPLPEMLYVPSGHNEQLDDPTSEYRPERHNEQFTLPTLALNEPASHNTQPPLPITRLPTGHTDTHDELPANEY